MLNSHTAESVIDHALPLGACIQGQVFGFYFSSCRNTSPVQNQRPDPITLPYNFTD